MKRIAIFSGILISLLLNLPQNTLAANFSAVKLIGLPSTPISGSLTGVVGTPNPIVYLPEINGGSTVQPKGLLDLGFLNTILWPSYSIPAVTDIFGGTIIFSPVHEAVLYNAYKAYFRLHIDQGRPTERLMQSKIDILQPYYSIDLSQILIVPSTNTATETSAITDCHRIYFDPLYINRITNAGTQLGIDVSATRLLLHELRHAEQCSDWAGRKNYSLRWFADLSLVTGYTYATILAALVKKQSIGNFIHDSMPMEIDASKAADRIFAALEADNFGQNNTTTPAQTTPPSQTTPSNQIVVNYTIEEVAGAESSTQSWVYDINEMGTVIGKNYYWNRGLRTEVIMNTLNRINNFDQIVGNMFVGNSNLAHVFDPELGVIPLSSVMGETVSYGLDINDEGQVVGSVIDAAGNAQAVLWEGGTATLIGSLPNMAVGTAKRISRSGIVAGEARYSANSSRIRAFVWSKENGIQDLGTTTSNCVTGDSAVVYDINDKGEILGSVYTSSFYSPSYCADYFLYSNGKMTSLGEYGLIAMNNSGHFIGYEGWLGSAARGFIWSRDKGKIYLDDLVPNSGWSNLHPAEINEDGVIVGHGNYNGKARAFMMSPTY